MGFYDTRFQGRRFRPPLSPLFMQWTLVAMERVSSAKLMLPASGEKQNMDKLSDCEIVQSCICTEIVVLILNIVCSVGQLDYPNRKGLFVTLVYVKTLG